MQFYLAAGAGDREAISVRCGLSTVWGRGCCRHWETPRRRAD